MKSLLRSALMAASIFSSSTLAQFLDFNPVNNIKLSWAIPELTSQNNKGNIYFQMEADSSYQWVGVGIGSSMIGADMFVFYQNGQGNLTLSTRTANAHVMPQHINQPGVELLAGSGVRNGKLIANVRCASCVQKLDLSGKSGWISAWKSGSPLNSDSVDAIITEHDDMGAYQIPMNEAVVVSKEAVNPFIGAPPSKPGGISGGKGGKGGDSGIETSDTDDATSTIFLAHGFLMSAVFLLGYPLGAALQPLICKWWLHAGWQFLAFLGMWAGFGVGYVIAQRDNEFFTQTHTRLGVIVCALMGIQPILGAIHHAQYKKKQGRTIFSHFHIWYGRGVMALGIINGGCGLQLSQPPMAFKIAYAVVAGLVSAIYIASAIFGAVKRRRSVNSFKA